MTTNPAQTGKTNQTQNQRSFARLFGQPLLVAWVLWATGTEENHSTKS